MGLIMRLILTTNWEHIYPYLILMDNNWADDKADDEDVEYEEEEEDSR